MTSACRQTLSIIATPSTLSSLRLRKRLRSHVGMDTLPLELKQRICSFLTPKDLKALRLVSVDYSVAACRYVLPKIFLRNQSESRKVVKKIIRHPLLSKRVKEIVVDISRLRSYENFDDWFKVHKPKKLYIPRWADFEPTEAANSTTNARTERALRRARTRYEQALRDASHTEQEMHDFWSTHQRLSKSQSKQSSKAFMLERIAETFSACPKLDVLAIAEPCMFDGILPLTYSGVCALKRSRFSLWEILEQVSRPLSVLKMIDLSSEQSTPVSVVIFENIQEIHVLYTSTGSYRYNCFHSIIKILRFAQSLKTLKIGVPRSCYHHPALNKLHVASLQQLEFDGIDVQEDVLVNLLLRHKELQRLIMNRATLNYGDWSSFAGRVAGQLPALKEVHLSVLSARYSRLIMHTDEYASVIGRKIMQSEESS